jgi:hypothetical protein
MKEDQQLPAAFQEFERLLDTNGGSDGRVCLDLTFW